MYVEGNIFLKNLVGYYLNNDNSHGTEIRNSRRVIPHLHES